MITFQKYKIKRAVFHFLQLENRPFKFQNNKFRPSNNMIQVIIVILILKVVCLQILQQININFQI